MKNNEVEAMANALQEGATGFSLLDPDPGPRDPREERPAAPAVQEIQVPRAGDLVRRVTVAYAVSRAADLSRMLIPQPQGADAYAPSHVHALGASGSAKPTFWILAGALFDAASQRKGRLLQEHTEAIEARKAEVRNRYHRTYDTTTDFGSQEFTDSWEKWKQDMAREWNAIEPEEDERAQQRRELPLEIQFNGWSSSVYDSGPFPTPGFKDTSTNINLHGTRTGTLAVEVALDSDDLAAALSRIHSRRAKALNVVVCAWVPYEAEYAAIKAHGALGFVLKQEEYHAWLAEHLPLAQPKLWL